MAGARPIGSNPYPYPNPTLYLTHTLTLTRTLPLSLTLSRYVVHRVEDGEPILREEVILDEVAVGVRRPCEMPVGTMGVRGRQTPIVVSRLRRPPRGGHRAMLRHE